jgi:hypothetical protein
MPNAALFLNKISIYVTLELLEGRIGNSGALLWSQYANKFRVEYKEGIFYYPRNYYSEGLCSMKLVNCKYLCTNTKKYQAVN